MVAANARHSHLGVCLRDQETIVRLIHTTTLAMGDEDMADDEMATMHESGAPARVHEANMQLRQLAHQFLTGRVTLTPEEALQTQRELAALGLGTAWLHAKLRDMTASAQGD